MSVGSLLKNLIMKNSAMKFFSLLLAIFLWFFIMGEKKAEFSFGDVPLVLLNKPSDLIITDQTADRINLRVSGSRTVLSTLSSSNIKATIDLEEVKPGTTVFKDLIEKVKLPYGTKITSISPAEFSLTLDSVVVNKVPVHLDMKGSPQEGYEISRISIKPEFVDVSLAKSEAKELKKVMTAPLDISGVKENVEEEIALVLTGLDPPRSISERKVEVSILISEKIVEKTMTNVAVELINSQYKTKVNPATFQLTVKGPYHLIHELSGKNVSARIDLKGLKPGEYSKKAEIRLPEKVSLVEAKPLRFKIAVSKNPLKSKG